MNRVSAYLGLGLLGSAAVDFILTFRGSLQNPLIYAETGLGAVSLALGVFGKSFRSVGTVPFGLAIMAAAASVLGVILSGIGVFLLAFPWQLVDSVRVYFLCPSSSTEYCEFVLAVFRSVAIVSLSLGLGLFFLSKGLVGRGVLVTSDGDFCFIVLGCGRNCPFALGQWEPDPGNLPLLVPSVTTRTSPL